MVCQFLADYRDKPINGPEHEALRRELWIGGADLVCCYYLSMLTGKDYSALPLKKVWQDLRAYVLEHASPAAIAFVHDPTPDVSSFALPLLKEQFGQAFGIVTKTTKEDKGMILLLRHPQWTDEDIRIALKTTEEQMHRWGWYQRARGIQAHYELENSGSTGHPTCRTR